MEMPKPSAEMVDRFGTTPDGGPDSVRKKMFGQPAAFVHGHLYTGLFGDAWQVRLGETDRAELESLGGTPFAPMGRKMTGYTLLPDSILFDDAARADWVARAYAFTATIPPKEAKPRAPRKKA